MLPNCFEFLERRQSALSHALTAGTVRGSGERMLLTEAQRAVHTYVCGVSGSGKSRFLQSLIFQDIAKGHPICVLDPMGDLYDRIREFVATCLERAGERGFPRNELLPRYLFLDAADPANPIRFNPLEPQGGESSEAQVDDLMKALERLLGGTLEEQRKLRNLLRGTFFMLAELNRLPPHRSPPFPRGLRATYPLTISFAVDLLNLSDRERLAFMAALPETTRLHFRRKYWEFYAGNSEAQKNLIVQSSWNAFQYLLDDSLVLNVLDAAQSTVVLADVVRQGTSLIVHLPLGQNLTGARFLGKYIVTKLQHTCYRRPEAEWSRPYYLYLDEFHQWSDQAFADAMTNLRKFGLRVTNAHQSQTQPPFDSPEGQALLRTIKGNSRTKAIFRLDRADAEVLSKELFELSQRKENFTVSERAVTAAAQEMNSEAISSGRSEGSGQRSARAYGEIGEDRFSTSRDRQYGSSSGSQRSTGTTRGRSETETTRTVYYTLEGERELCVNALQRLGDRECYLFTGALTGQLIEPLAVPDLLYCYCAENLPARLLEEQRSQVVGVPLAVDQVDEKLRRVVVPLVTQVRPLPPAQGEEVQKREKIKTGDTPWSF